jgi:hypothetical protein
MKYVDKVSRQFHRGLRYKDTQLMDVSPSRVEFA